MAAMKQDLEKQMKWQKENMQLIGLRLHNKNDADILEYLSKHEDQENGKTKQAIIKQILHEYIAAHQEEEK